MPRGREGTGVGEWDVVLKNCHGILDNNLRSTTYKNNSLYACTGFTALLAETIDILFKDY